nr:MAG TPA: hypothetical protein [Caudoviricetes sp.]
MLGEHISMLLERKARLSVKSLNQHGEWQRCSLQ